MDQLDGRCHSQRAGAGQFLDAIFGKIAACMIEIVDDIAEIFAAEKLIHLRFNLQ